MIINLPTKHQVLKNQIPTILDLKAPIYALLHNLAENFNEESAYSEHPKNLKLPRFQDPEALIDWLNKFENPSKENRAYLRRLIYDNQFIFGIVSNRQKIKSPDSVTELDFLTFHLIKLIRFLLKNLIDNNTELDDMVRTLGLTKTDLTQFPANLVNSIKYAENLDKNQLPALKVLLAAVKFLESHLRNAEEVIGEEKKYPNYLDIIAFLEAKIQELKCI